MDSKLAEANNGIMPSNVERNLIIVSDGEWDLGDLAQIDGENGSTASEESVGIAATAFFDKIISISIGNEENQGIKLRGRSPVKCIDEVARIPLDDALDWNLQRAAEQIKTELQLNNF